MNLLQMSLLLFSFLIVPAASADIQNDEISLITYLKIKPGTETSFKAALNKIIKPSLAEPGNIAWFVQESVKDPTMIVFFTRWKNEGALQTHLKSKPLVEYIAETAPFLELGYPQLVRFNPIDQARKEVPSGGYNPDNCDQCWP